MTKESIPVTGDRLPDGFPSLEKIVKTTFGATSGEVQCSCQATFGLCTIPKYAQVTDVGWTVEKIFTDTLTITLGDTNDAAGWAEAGDITATATNAYIVWASKVYNATDGTDTNPAYHYAPPLYASCPEDLEAVVGTATPATGQLSVYVKYHMAYGQKHY